MLRRRDLLIVFLVALVIRLATLFLVQPRLGVDGLGYITSARALLTDGPGTLRSLPLEHSPLYTGFIAVGTLVGMDPAWFATLIQACLGAATASILAQMTARECQNRLAGICAGAIAAAQISFVFWVTYALSETLFLFLLAWSANAALQLGKARAPFRAAIGVGLITAASIAARPTGVAYVGAVLLLVVVLARHDPRLLGRLLGGFCLPLVVFGGSAVVLDGPHLADFARSSVQNGLVETDNGRATSGVDLDVNPPPIVESLPPEQRAEFIAHGPLAFAEQHPAFVVNQALRKLRLFWTPALPEYSLVHAIGSSLYFVGFYLLAIVGFVRVHRPTPLVVLSGSSVVLFTLLSLVTIVDYDQRYRLPAELFLVPMAGIGLSWLATRAFRPGALSARVQPSLGGPQPSKIR